MRDFTLICAYRIKQTHVGCVDQDARPFAAYRLSTTLSEDSVHYINPELMQSEFEAIKSSIPFWVKLSAFDVTLASSVGWWAALHRFVTAPLVSHKL